MNDHFRLLDLPDLALEQVLLHCKKGYGAERRKYENPLLNLTECCRFLKNYIERNPFLMRKLSLSVQTNLHYSDTTEEEVEETLAACLNSTRKFVAASFYFYNSYPTFEYEYNESEINEKMVLADMHCKTIKSVKFVFDGTETDSKAVLFVLKLMENLINVESVTVVFGGYPKHKNEYLEKPEGWNWSYYGNSYKFPNEFQHLKHLAMEAECATVFNVFQTCKTLETLELTRFGWEKPVDFNKLELLLNNSRKSLKTLKVEFSVSEQETFDRFSNLLVALDNSGINLKTLEITAYHSNLKSTELLLKFLKSQKSLEILKLYKISGIIFNEKFEVAMAGHTKLKTLEIGFGGKTVKGSYDDYLKSLKNDEESDEEIENYDFLTTPWILPNLEEMKLTLFKSKEKCKVPYNLFQNFSDKMKKFKLQGNFKLHDTFFENISKKFEALIELKIDVKCSGYSSNDIFWILKHMKQLKYLKFTFPEDSELNPDLFDNNEYLSLPEIYDVALTFNDSFEIDHAVKLLQLMSNMSFFWFKIWKNYNSGFFIHITRDLQNLIDIGTSDYIMKIESSVLLKVQSNVLEFNRKPDRFKIEGCGLSSWMRKAVRTEAGGSSTKKLKLN